MRRAMASLPRVVQDASAVPEVHQGAAGGVARGVRAAGHHASAVLHHARSGFSVA